MAASLGDTMENILALGWKIRLEALEVSPNAFWGPDAESKDHGL